MDPIGLPQRQAMEELRWASRDVDLHGHGLAPDELLNAPQLVEHSG